MAGNGGGRSGSGGVGDPAGASGDGRGAGVELIPDGHHVVIRGRRWRATDPELPPEVADRLRHELMSARRAVGAALRAADADAERAARARVHAAKTGLGERGIPWWTQSPADRRARWESALSSRPDPG